MSLILEPGRGERRTRKEFKVILAYIASLGIIISVFAFLKRKGTATRKKAFFSHHHLRVEVNFKGSFL